MRPAIAVGVYLGLVFMGGALLAPWLYWGGQASSGVFPALQEFPFHRYLNRSFLLLAVVGVWPLLRYTRVRSLDDIGLTWRTPEWRNLAGGLALGFAMLALVAALALICGARTFRTQLYLADLMHRTASAIGSAVFVAVLEEVLFRGMLFGALRKSVHWVTALLLSSIFYSWVHFIDRAPQPEAVTWLSGLESLPHIVLNPGNPGFIPSFITLAAAGMLLGFAYQKTRTLWFSIGLHAGWVFWLKFYSAVTTRVPDVDFTWWGTGRLINGWASAIVMCGAGLFMAALWGWRPQRPRQ